MKFIFLLAAMLMLTGCRQPPAQRRVNRNKNPVVTIEMEDGGIIKAELYPTLLRIPYVILFL